MKLPKAHKPVFKEPKGKEIVIKVHLPENPMDMSDIGFVWGMNNNIRNTVVNAVKEALTVEYVKSLPKLKIDIKNLKEHVETRIIEKLAENALEKFKN